MSWKNFRIQIENKADRIEIQQVGGATRHLDRNPLTGGTDDIIWSAGSQVIGPGWLVCLVLSSGDRGSQLRVF